MFTGTHLASLILNAIVPLFWMSLIIKHICDYYKLKVFAAERNKELDRLEGELPEVKDDTPIEVANHVHVAKVNAAVLRERTKIELGFARATMLFWVTLAFLFSICAAMTVIDNGIKVYHGKCPFEQHSCGDKVEVQVENAKEGPQFTATLTNVKLEEEKND